MTPSALAASVTGITPWWTYQSRDIPGVGAAMVNVANLNFLFLEDDVDIPGAGLGLSFNRIYNSQSQHNANNDDGSTPSVFGNRWTNNLDVHLGWSSTGSNTGTVSVYSGDGARDDYSCQIDVVATCTSQTPGIHDLLATTQVTGGVACELQWTKKSGVSYIFNAPYSACGKLAGQYGRLLAIYGRNSNFSIQLAYSWSPDASSPENIAQIIATHQPDGTQLTLTFGQVTGSVPPITELMSVARPDGQTINYHYSANGDLADIDKPGNMPVLLQGQTLPTNFLDGAPIATGNLPETYAKQTENIEVCGPRAAISIIDTNQNPTDGACVDFDFNAAHQLTDWFTRGVLNPTPGDNVSPSPIQPEVSTGFVQWDDTTFFTNIVGACGQMTDASGDFGHDTQWCHDSRGRVTQTSALVSGSTFLTSSQSWDPNNNLTTVTDARGKKTDIAYDDNANVLEVSLPSQTTSQGELRPTSLSDYDDHNNLLNYCDPANNPNNSWNPSPGPTPCAGGGSTHYTKLTYETSDSEPYGCLGVAYMPSGYRTRVTYSATVNGGNRCDVGLPYQVRPDTYPQADGTTRNTTQTFTYGTAGNLKTYTKNYPNNATWQLTYTTDGLHRIAAIADPDGVTSYRCYYMDGSVFFGETPIQDKFDFNGSGPTCPTPTQLLNGATPPPFAAAYGYDPDGDLVRQLVHHNCTNPNATPAPTPCAATKLATTKCNNVFPSGGTTCNFYDGLDRLVEVKQPYQADSIDLYTTPWITRYLYDLTGNQHDFGGNAFSAYGNLFKVQERVPPAASPSASAPPSHGSIANTIYVALKATAYDGLDRPVGKYSTNGTAVYTETLTWDSSPLNNDLAGLLGRDCNSAAPQQCERFDYLPDGELRTANSNDSSSPERNYTYDPDGRPTKILSLAYTNPQTYGYDVDGLLQTSTDAGNTSNGRATLTHNRYPDGAEKSLDVASGALTQSGLFTYSYRNDGPVQTEEINDTQVAQIAHAGKTTLAYTYTDLGRLAGRSESGAAALPSPQTTILYQFDPPTGLVREQDTPVTNLTDFTYTAESEIAQVSSSANNPACLFPSSTYTYTIRGELVNSPQCNTTRPTIPFEANGLALHASGTNAGEQYTWNPLLAVVTEQLATGPDSCNGSPCQSLWQYDAAGRMTSQQAPYPMIAPTPNNTTANHTYDAENHLTSTVLNRLLPELPLHEVTSWGPDGHPIRIGTYAGSDPQKDERLHWNGDQLLFTTNQTNGLTLDDIKVDVQGDILPGDTGYNGLTFYDRGPGGTILGCHNATGTSYVGLTDGWLGTTPFPCSANLSAGARMPTSTLWMGTPYGGSIGLGSGRTIGMPRTDGFVDGLNTIQGVRAYDSNAGQWTSPDRFVGSDTDPASQKSYMWNGNNPLNNSDPSGLITNLPQPASTPMPAPPPAAAAGGGSSGGLEVIATVTTHCHCVHRQNDQQVGLMQYVSASCAIPIGDMISMGCFTAPRKIVPPHPECLGHGAVAGVLDPHSLEITGLSYLLSSRYVGRILSPAEFFGTTNAAGLGVLRGTISAEAIIGATNEVYSAGCGM